MNKSITQFFCTYFSNISITYNYFYNINYILLSIFKFEIFINKFLYIKFTIISVMLHLNIVANLLIEF
jgi:hypothetical protein